MDELIEISKRTYDDLKAEEAALKEKIKPLERFLKESGVIPKRHMKNTKKGFIPFQEGDNQKED